MGTVNVTLGDGKKLNLVLGQQLENAVTAVVFDFSAWQTEFGSGTLGLSVQRHGDTQPYAVVPTVSGTNATWNISELDTAYKGVGEVQVTYTVGSVVKKSTVYKFTVYRSLGENGEYPSPGQTWQQEIEADIADVKQDLSTITELTSSAQNFIWENGEISSGADVGHSSKRIRTIGFYKTHENEVVTSETNWYFYVVYYNSSYTFQTSKGWNTGNFFLDTQYPYYRLFARNTNSNLDITPSDGANYSATYMSDFVNDILSLNNGTQTYEFIWEVGMISSGSDASSSKRLRTIGYHNTKNKKLFVDNGWFIAIAYYDSSRVFKISEYWENGVYYVNQTYPYFRVMLRNSDSNMDMSVSYASHVICKQYSIYDQYIDQNSDAPKSYLLSTLNSAISRANTDYALSKLMFVWVTDSHLNPSKQSNVRVWKDTIDSIRYVCNNLPIRFLLHTGDYVDLNYYTDGASNTEVFNALSKSIRDVYDVDHRLLIANGNHDGVGANGYGNVQWYYGGNGSINNEYAIKQEVPNAYSYKDFKDLKLRVITLSMPDSNQSNTYYWGFSHEQIQWIINDALNIDDGWGIIITIHAPMLGTNNSSPYGHVDVVYGILNAFHSHTTYQGSYTSESQTVNVDVDYTGMSATHVVACFAGHTHGDAVIDVGEEKNGQENGLPCPVIVSGASWFDATAETGYTAPSRTYEDATEILFNIVSYYPTEKKIEVVRVGAGNDMTIQLT